MGVVNGIGFDRFPRQSDWVGKRCWVMFEYDSSKQLVGTVVRDDEGEPGRMIIRLEDGRHLLSTECQHTIPE